MKRLWLLLACALTSLGCRDAAVDEPDLGPEPAPEPAAEPTLVYDASSGGLVTTQSQLMAIRVSRIGLDEPAVFHEAPERFPLNDFKYWSSDGEVLIFDEGWFELSDASWENRLLFSRYEQGALTSPRLIPDLPGEGSYSIADFDVTTHTALVSNRDELYAVRFDGDEPASALALRSDEYLDAWLCRGATNLLYGSYGSDARIAPLDATAGDSAPLGPAYWLAPSPDRALVAVTYVDDETYGEQLSLGRCSLEPELAVVAESDASVELAWSPDGSRIVLSGSSGDASWLKVLALSGGPPGELLFEGEGDLGEASWSEDGDAIAVQSATDDRWSLLRVAAQSFEPLPSDVAFVYGWAGRYLVVANDQGDTLVIDTTLDSEPVPVLAAGDGSIFDFVVEPGGQRFACARRNKLEELDELFVIEPALGAEGVELVYSGARVPSLLAFPGDDLGVLGAVEEEEESELWWFPLGPELLREPIVYAPAGFPALQPLP